MEDPPPARKQETRELITCPLCKGKVLPCGMCGGKGTMTCAACRGKGSRTWKLIIKRIILGVVKLVTTAKVTRCPTCRGRRQLPCPACQGLGVDICPLCDGRHELFADEVEKIL